MITETVMDARTGIPETVRLSLEKRCSAEFRHALGATGLRQSQLSELLDVHANTVSQWATGKVRMPGPVRAYMSLRARVRDLVNS